MTAYRYTTSETLPAQESVREYVGKITREYRGQLNGSLGSTTASNGVGAGDGPSSLPLRRRTAPLGTFSEQLAELLDYLPHSGIELSEQEETALSKIRRHRWFNPEDKEAAQQALRGVLAALLQERPDLAPFPLGGFIDAYHHDRAAKAAEFLGGDEPPILPRDVPSVPPGHHNYYGPYKMKVRQVRGWESGTPYEVLPEVTRIITEAVPDQLIMVTYTQQAIRYDPILYATYGPYWVKVAEWE